MIGGEKEAMTNFTLVILAIVAVIAALAVAWTYTTRRRRDHLRARFGPEYDRSLRDTGSERRTEAVLADREHRVSSYHIRTLSADERAKFSDAWKRVQAKFVDDPAGAVTEGDRLVNDVMTTRGYPMTDFDRRAEDLTVEHAGVVHHYRAAREIAGRHSRHEASTEDLRQALVHYRELFADLLDERNPARRSA
jgi:hypothetical protein